MTHRGSTFAVVAVSAIAGLTLLSACPSAVEAGEGEGEGEGEDELTESEPNGGTPETDVDALPVNASLRGVIADAGDADVFHLDGTLPGHVYRATLRSDGALDGHLTILDDGRNDDAAGNDYVRLHRAPDGGDAIVEFASLGGGVFVIVRDARDVDGDGQGGADFGYVLSVSDVTAEVTGAALTVPGTLQGDFAGPGSVLLLPFAASAGDDVRVDFSADGDVDARLFVVSASLGDWIARNDDGPRAPDPLIDAPLLEEGPYLLLVENNTEAPSALGFDLTISLP